MDIKPSNPRRYLWVLIPLVPLAGYAIYRNLTPEQKTKFKNSLSKGTFGMVSALLTQLVDTYRSNRTGSDAEATSKNGTSTTPKMAAIPADDESETTGGDEKW